jgi:hypothetical protein
MTAPRRRWFRFSLRTLFVVVTLLACWLAWNRSLVERRRAFLEKLRSSNEYKLYTYEDVRSAEFAREYHYDAPLTDAEFRAFWAWRSRLVSLGLTLFGEKAYALVLVTDPSSWTEASFQPVIDAFPEASVCVESPVGAFPVSGPLKSAPPP